MLFREISRALFLIIAFSTLLIAACSSQPDNSGSKGDSSEQSSSGSTAPDTIAPLLANITPTNGQLVGPTYTLSGQAEDSGSGVSNVFVCIDNGAFSPASFMSGNWSTNLSTAAYGLHTNRIFAMDNEGNVSSTNLIVVERAAVPSIVFTFPAVDIYTNNSSVQLSGSASVDVPYSLTALKIKQNNGVWYPVTGADPWGYSTTLTPGSNSFQVLAVSSGGQSNLSSQKLIIYDITAPSVSITSPIAWIYSKNCIINGTASDNLKTSKIYLSLNGGNFSALSLSSSTWTTNLTLIPITNTLSVYCEDMAGNISATNSREIYLAEPLYTNNNIIYTNYPNATAAVIGYTASFSGNAVIITNIYNIIPVRSIITNAFVNCAGLTGVIIPDTVKSIENFTFMNCRNLSNVNLPGTITNIGYNSFCGCSNLLGIYIPNTTTSIGSGAFAYTGLTNNPIPSTTTYVGYYVFSYCANLTNVSVYNSVLGFNEFEHCQGLSNVTLSDSILEIPPFAFDRCSNLISITMGNSITNIGDAAFRECHRLANFIFPTSLKRVESSAFRWCTNLKNINISGSIKSISSESFYACMGVTNIYVQNSVTNIGEKAFSSCRKLSNVIIPNSLTSISAYLYEGCNLTYIDIPDSVRNIDYMAFVYNWPLTNIHIGSSVTNIGDSAFSYCTNLTGVIMPASVVSIQDHCFENCTKLSLAVISNGNCSIKANTFTNMPGFTIKAPAGGSLQSFCNANGISFAGL